jgi:hypothetical protein
MDQAEIDHREQNLNAHFAWSLALWGSAEMDRKSGNLICAAYAYYYAVLNAGFASMNAFHLAPFDDLQKVDHQVILRYFQNWFLGDHANELYRLKQIREATSYLALESPAAKLRVVRGHGFGFRNENGSDRISFLEAVNEVAQASKSLIRYLLGKTHDFCSVTKLRHPTTGADSWLEDYLGEDLFPHVFPDNSRSEILRAGFSLLKSE